MLPVKKGRISQEYGRPGPYRKGYHSGIDIVAGEGDKYVYAVNPGTVIRARYDPGPRGADPQGWGNYVIVRQPDGHDALYAHLARVLVIEEQVLAAGDVIGLQGNTGNTTGPHLHFEVWDGSWEERRDIDPAEYLGIQNEVGPVQSADPFEEDRFWAMTKGISDGSDPERPATRKEVWAMLRRMDKDK